mmetsp:Transcript_75462/g.177169  ORF Transcript_75462/g.177169 Transcript_75462/m.177169 type:complete len:177 (-) Transcript_75462:834-1364(-)
MRADVGGVERGMGPLLGPVLPPLLWRVERGIGPCDMADVGVGAGEKEMRLGDGERRAGDVGVDTFTVGGRLETSAEGGGEREAVVVGDAGVRRGAGPPSDAGDSGDVGHDDVGDRGIGPESTSTWRVRERGIGPWEEGGEAGGVLEAVHARGIGPPETPRARGAGPDEVEEVGEAG